MNQHNSFGRLIYGKLVYAPWSIVEGSDGENEAAEEAFLKHGYKKVVLEEQPPAIYGKIQKAYYDETDDTIYRKYRYEDIAPDYTTIFLDSYKQTLNQLKQIKNSLIHVGVYETNLIHYWQSTDEGFRLLYNVLMIRYPGYNVEKLAKLFFDKRGTAFTYNHDNKGILAEPSISEHLARNGITGFELMTPLMTIYASKMPYEQTQYRMIFSYLHTVFDDFLSKVIRLIVSLYPLGASLKVDITPNDLFSCDSIDFLREKVIASKIDSLGYDNYQAKIEFIKQHGVTPTLPETAYMDDIILFCEQRNVLVHNDGVVNSIFINKLFKTQYKDTYKIGDTIEFDLDSVKDALSKVSELCRDLYNEVEKKFFP